MGPCHPLPHGLIFVHLIYFQMYRILKNLSTVVLNIGSPSYNLFEKDPFDMIRFFIDMIKSITVPLRVPLSDLSSGTPLQTSIHVSVGRKIVK